MRAVPFAKEGLIYDMLDIKHNFRNHITSTDWSIKRLSQVVSLLKDGTHGTHKDCSTGKYLLSAKDIINGKVVCSDVSRIISEKDFNNIHKKYKLQNNDIVLTIVGTIGRSAIITNYNQEYTFQRSVAIIRSNSFVLPKFLYIQIQSTEFQAELKKRQSVSAQPGVYLEELAGIPCIVPPLPEQEKIAKILSCWDVAIEQMQSLIAEKKELKRGLMQKLLTGKIRLPGFTSIWENKKLGDLFNVQKGDGLSKELLKNSGKNKCILYGELYTKYAETITEVSSKTDAADGVVSQSGDILIPASTTTIGIDLANATALFENDVLLGGDINILRKKEDLDSAFFAYALTNAYKYELARLAQGITIVHLYGEHIKSVRVSVPSNTEQKAIADILMSADAEIDLLTKKLDVLKEQKKGLMQKLLTGEIRVKVGA